MMMIRTEKYSPQRTQRSQSEFTGFGYSPRSPRALRCDRISRFAQPSNAPAQIALIRAPFVPGPHAVSSTRLRREYGGSAFTLIEVLTVIAIILVLIGLFVGGWKKLSNSSSKQLTLTRLEMLNGMLAEMESTGHNTFSTQPWMQSTIPSGASTIPNTLDASLFGNITSDDTPNPPVTDGTGSLSAKNDTVTVAQVATMVAYNNRGLAIQYLSKPSGYTSPVVTTAVTYPTGVNSGSGIMSQLQALPNNAKALAGLTSDATALDVMTTYNLASPNNAPTGPPAILDGWGNPIIFVPAGGLANVYTNTNTTSATSTTVTSPDGRPFWVSAGPDGDLIRGDDNIYSFDLH